YNDLDRMQQWMSDAFPTDSRSEAARSAANDFPLDRADLAPAAIGTRTRYESGATDVLASVTTDTAGAPLPATLADPQPLQLAEYRADQLMLGRSILVPHCSEFIVEWSFGNLDPSGQVIWHGPDRQAGATYLARPYPWDAGHTVPREHKTVVGSQI